jgi:flagellar basal body rod protein FlgF
LGCDPSIAKSSLDTLAGKASNFGGVRTCGFRAKYDLNVPLMAVIGLTTFFEPAVMTVHPVNGMTRGNFPKVSIALSRTYPGNE